MSESTFIGFPRAIHYAAVSLETLRRLGHDADDPRGYKTMRNDWPEDFRLPLLVPRPVEVALGPLMGDARGAV